MSEPRGLRRPCARTLAPLVLVTIAACGDDGGTTPPIDAGPTITTAHCSYEPVPAGYTGSVATLADGRFATDGDTGFVMVLEPRGSKG